MTAARGPGGELVVCNDWRLAVAMIRQTILEFRERYPRVDVTLAGVPAHEQLTALRAGRIHLGFLPREMLAVRDDLDLPPVVVSDVVAVLDTGHPLAGREHIVLRDLHDATWMWVDDGDARGYRAFLIQLCRLAGFTPHFGKPSASLTGMLAAIASGCGVALAPRMVLPVGMTMTAVVTTDCDPLGTCAVWRHGETSRLPQNFPAIMQSKIPGARAPATGLAEDSRPRIVTSS